MVYRRQSRSTMGRNRNPFSNPRLGVPAAQRRRISTLVLGRFARSLISNVSGVSVSLSGVWPGRADRLIIAPHDLRTSDATRAAEIYAAAYGKDPEFYAFHRSLEAYRESLADGRTTLVLDPDSEFLQYLEKSRR